MLTSPVCVAMMLFIAAFAAALLRRTRAALWIAAVSACWCLFWTSPATYRWLASGLEMQFPVVLAEDAPQADAIVVLGGGIGTNTNAYPYGEMWCSADRVWHGARLYRAGKAPVVYLSGGQTTVGTRQLLRDLGVPAEAIRVNLDARNTEEEAKCIGEGLRRTETAVPKILLVTSAWHMRRAKLMFEKYAKGVEVIPAATDYEALVRCGWKCGFGLEDLIPNAEMMFQSSYMIKEIIAYWGYRWFR